MLSKIFFTEVKQSAHLALPLVAAALAQVGMEVVDTVMMGRLGPLALAAGALGGVVFIILLVLGMGVLSGVSVLVAGAHSANRRKRLTKVVRQGLWLSVFLTVPFTIILWYSPEFLLKIGELPEIVASTRLFIHALAWGILPFMVFLAVREFVAGISKPRVIMLIALISIPLNAILNYILIYGKFGLPRLGIAGIGYATAIVEWLSLGMMIIYIIYFSAVKKYKIFAQMDTPNLKLMNEIFRIGYPMGILYGVNTGLFTIATFLIGYFGMITLAAHQIAFQTVNIAFMTPLGISEAAAIRVSRALGEDDLEGAKLAGNAGILLGLISGGIAILCFWLLPHQIIRLFINPNDPANKAVVSIAKVFLYIGGIFTLMDGLTIILTGILRGYKDSFVAMWIGVVSYWIIGLGAAYFSAFEMDWKGDGIWFGLALGITCSALLLYWRYHTINNRKYISYKA